MEICKNCVVLEYIVKGEGNDGFFCPWKDRIIGSRGKSCSKFKDKKEGYFGKLRRGACRMWV